MSDERAANAVDKKVGQRVRTRRLEIGMSQERLANCLALLSSRFRNTKRASIGSR